MVTPESSCGLKLVVPIKCLKFYLDAVKEFGIPLKIRADNGTEHSIVDPIHTYLRHTDGREGAIDSFGITTSPQNQRIEAYWSILQRDRIGWWRRFFNDLTDLEYFSAEDPVQIDCIRFCFMRLIREDLHSILSDWNSHIISKSRYGGVTGRPDTLFFLPHLQDKEDYSSQVDLAEVEEFDPVLYEPRDYSVEFEEFATLANEEQHRPERPETVAQALDLYLFLLIKIHNI